MLNAKHVVGPGVSQVGREVVQGCLVSGLCLMQSTHSCQSPFTLLDQDHIVVSTWMLDCIGLTERKKHDIPFGHVR